MKKIYTQFKLYFVAALLLAFAGKANAEVTIDDIAGTYKFKATLTINDNDYAELLTDEFTFTIANNSGLQIKGFIVESQSCYAGLSDGQIAFNQQYMDPNGVITLSNTNGDYPYGNPPIFPTWNVDDKGNITIPDFTVLSSLNHGAQTAEIAALYSNCVVTKQAEESKPAVSFAGTYTVSGTQYYYNTDADVVSAEMSFTLSIDEEGNVYEIAGYEVPEVNGAQGVYGKIDNNTFTISTGNSYLTLGQTYYTLGDVGSAYSGKYDSEGTIVLSYSGDTWSITDFSVWESTWDAGEFKYTLKYFWTNLTVTKKDGAGNEEPGDKVITEDRKWDFTKWSDATVANLKADAAQGVTEGWSDVEKNGDTEPTEASKDNCFWAVATPDANGELSANGVVIEELKGLKFTATYAKARSLAIAVNYPKTDLGTYDGPAYLWLGGGSKSVACFTIPGVAAGYTVTMTVESHKTTDARGVELYTAMDEGDLVTAETKVGDSFKPTTKATNSWTIEEDGDIIVYNTSGCHIYSIEVTKDAPVGISTVNAEAANGAIYNLQGQKVEKAQKGLYIINGKKVVIK